MRTALAPSAILRARSRGRFALQQPAGEPAPAQAADARRRRRDPAERRHRLDVEAARVVEVLRQPEQVEVPRGVAQELRDHDAPGLAEAQQLQPAQLVSRGARGTEHRLDLAALRLAEPRVPLGREVVPVPPERPERGRGAPVRKKTQRQSAALSTSAISGGATTMPDGGARVDDAHGRRALLHREPLRHRPRRGGESAAFADAEQEPAERERADARGQPMAGAGERPEHHDDGEAPARAQDVHQLAAAGVHERVGDQERRLQLRELLVRDGDVARDRLDGHGQRLAVEVADGDRQPRRGRRFASGASKRGLHHSSTTSETAWRGRANCSVAWPFSTRSVAGASNRASWLAARSCAYCSAFGAIGEPMRFQSA